MKILVLNAGSSSQKTGLYELEATFQAAPQGQPLVPLWEAHIDWQQGKAEVAVEGSGQALEKTLSGAKAEVLGQVLETLYQGPTQVISALDDIDAVGHRVVHGGQDYRASTPVTPEVKAAIARLSALAPAHNPANLEGIELMEQRLGDIPQVAVFDTAFHSHMPDVAATYPGPYDWVESGIRRYGFHGISHQYCTQRTGQLLGQPPGALRLIICHLGNGCSLSAVQNGRSIDTTMGFTPLDGLMMGTRSGAVDPGILIHLIRQGYSADQLDHLLNRQSGLKGISGVSHDWRQIEQAIAQGNDRAKLAQQMYLYRLKACLGTMLMSLGGVDVLIFTGGIGEHSPRMRAATCDGLAFIGLKLDSAKNEGSPVDQDIATVGSTVRVLVIHTQEDWAIAQETQQCLASR